MCADLKQADALALHLAEHAEDMHGEGVRERLPVGKPKSEGPRPCSVEGCAKPVKAKALCLAHDQAKRRVTGSGDQRPRPAESRR